MKRTLWHAENLDPTSSQPFEVVVAQTPAERTQVDTEDEANIVSSLTEDGTHAPVLDLDIPHRYVPSSTPGHGHLYLDVELDWNTYVALLAQLHACGVIGSGFFYWSLRRQATFVRPPHVKKDTDPRELF